MSESVSRLKFEDISQQDESDSPVKELKKIHHYRFQVACQCLSETYLPEQILCRTDQIKRIKDFVQKFAKTGFAKESLYISGVPGIGKTLCTLNVLSQFETEKWRNKLKVVKINCMNLKNQGDIFKVLLKQLAGNNSNLRKQASSYNSLVTLDEILRHGDNQALTLEQMQIRNQKKLVLIDEIDYLKTNNEEILYNLFDWTQNEKSRLAIIAISNTIDFPEKLKPKILSRIGNNRLVFPTYKSSELEKILCQRIKEVDIFQSNVLQIITKKVALSSTDIRKCLNLLKDSIFLHLKQTPLAQQASSRIPAKTVVLAYDNLYLDHFTEFFKLMPKNYQQILMVLAQHNGKTNKPIAFEVIHTQSNLRRKIPIDPNSTKGALQILTSMGIIDCKQSVASMAPHKYLKKNVYKLAVKYQRILYANSKYGEEI